MTILRILFLAVFVVLFPAIAGQDDTANAQAGFFPGKIIRIVVGSSPGGGYDYWARLMAHHMPQYVAGNSEVVVQNMPGGGSLIATIYRCINNATYMSFIRSQIPLHLFGILLDAAKR